MSDEKVLCWQIYKKNTIDALGHKVGIIRQGYKIPPYSSTIEIFEGTQDEAIKRAEAIERLLNIS